MNIEQSLCQKEGRWTVSRGQLKRTWNLPDHSPFPYPPSHHCPWSFSPISFLFIELIISASVIKSLRFTAIMRTSLFAVHDSHSVAACTPQWFHKCQSHHLTYRRGNDGAYFTDDFWLCLSRWRWAKGMWLNIISGPSRHSPWSPKTRRADEAWMWSSVEENSTSTSSNNGSTWRKRSERNESQTFH